MSYNIYIAFYYILHYYIGIYSIYSYIYNYFIIFNTIYYEYNLYKNPFFFNFIIVYYNSYLLLQQLCGHIISPLNVFN